MDVKKQIFLALQDHLVASIPSLQWIDKNMGQIATMDQQLPIPMPGILIGFGSTQWLTISAGLKQGQAIISIITLYENYADSFTGSVNQDIALSYFDFTELVTTALEGFSGPNFTPLILIADQEDEDHANFIVTVLQFSTVITNTSSVNKNTTTVEPELSVTYNNEKSRPEGFKSGFVEAG